MKLSMVGGPSRAACLCRLANGLGVSPVLSSAFESGVGLAHAAIFASCFAAEGKNIIILYHIILPIRVRFGLLYSS